MTATVHHGDCRDVLAAMARDDVLFDACVTDPPYDLVTGGFNLRTMTRNGKGQDNAIRRAGKGPSGFLGQAWDGTGVAFNPATWRAVYDVLRPGAHLLAFGGTRTWHRMAVAIEDAGFEIRDTLSWNYASGFPKGQSVNRALGDSICSCDQPEILPEMRRNTLSASAVSYPKVLRSHLRRGGQARNNADVGLPDLQSALDVGYPQTGALQQDMLPEVCGTDDRCGTDAGDPSGSPAQEQDADDLLCLPDSVLSKRQACRAGEGADVFSAVQRGGADQDASSPCFQGTRQLDSGISGQRDCKDDWPKESGLEGRDHPAASEGSLRPGSVCALPAGNGEHGTSGRVCDGAPASDGPHDGLAAGADGVRASPGPQPVKQRAGKSRTVAGQPDAQVSGTWQRCDGCGKPRIPSGLGTTLKPAYELIIVARKPLIGTVAANVLAHGTGALNIDACRVPNSNHDPAAVRRQSRGRISWGDGATSGFADDHAQPTYDAKGRWPANIIHDGSDEVLAAFAAYGESTASAHQRHSIGAIQSVAKGREYARVSGGHSDTGTAARFFMSCGYGADEWNALASNANLYFSLSSGHVVSVLNDAVTSAALGAVLHAGSYQAPSMNVTGAELSEICSLVTETIQGFAAASLRGPQPGKRTLSNSLASCAVEPGPNGTMTITVGPSTSDGVAGVVTFAATLPSMGLGGVGFPAPSRFHYSAKATVADRAGSKHPTVKPQSLMRYLCTLVTPPGGHILDPFAGSGSTLQAAVRSGFDATGIEREIEYVRDARVRLHMPPADGDDGIEATPRNDPSQLSLFA